MAQCVLVEVREHLVREDLRKSDGPLRPDRPRRIHERELEVVRRCDGEDVGRQLADGVGALGVRATGRWNTAAWAVPGVPDEPTRSAAIDRPSGDQKNPITDPGRSVRTALE